MKSRVVGETHSDNFTCTHIPLSVSCLHIVNNSFEVHTQHMHTLTSRLDCNDCAFGAAFGTSLAKQLCELLVEIPLDKGFEPSL